MRGVDYYSVLERTSFSTRRTSNLLERVHQLKRFRFRKHRPPYCNIFPLCLSFSCVSRSRRTCHFQQPMYPQGSPSAHASPHRVGSTTPSTARHLQPTAAPQSPFGESISDPSRLLALYPLGTPFTPTSTGKNDRSLLRVVAKPDGASMRWLLRRRMNGG